MIYILRITLKLICHVSGQMGGGDQLACSLIRVLCVHSLELDTEGTIPPDDDPPQEMGDRSKEVTEDMRDKAQEERAQGSMAMAEGQHLGSLLCSATTFSRRILK